MLGFYVDSDESPTTRVTIHRSGLLLHASINVDISKSEPNGKQITFTEVSYNEENGVIEMFRDGASEKTSYFFTGVIKDNYLQGQLANTLGRILELDLKMTKSD